MKKSFLIIIGFDEVRQVTFSSIQPNDEVGSSLLNFFKREKTIKIMSVQVVDRIEIAM